MFNDKLTEFLLQQVYVQTNIDSFSGILMYVTDKVMVVRTMYPGYGDITDYAIRLDNISFVRIAP